MRHEFFSFLFVPGRSEEFAGGRKCAEGEYEIHPYANHATRQNNTDDKEHCPKPGEGIVTGS
jgi:hypothetical protein